MFADQSQHYQKPTVGPFNLWISYSFYNNMPYSATPSTMARQVSLTGTAVKTPRKSYSREFKLQVIKFYCDPQNTLYATSKHFSVDKKCILRWAHEETRIKKSSKGSKHCRHAKGGTYEKTEEVLAKEFLDLREKGLRMRGYWFKVRSK